MMSQSCQPERDPAEVYDELFVPALFAQWGPRVAEAAAIELAQRVLDVGCGTGVLACAAAQLVGPQGRVVGLDPNEQMLAVARRKPARVTWQLVPLAGSSSALPFNDASFDAVVSQFALMFFEFEAHRHCRDVACAAPPWSIGGGCVGLARASARLSGAH